MVSKLRIIWKQTVDEGGESQEKDKEKNQVEIDLEGLMTRTGVVPLGREGYHLRQISIETLFAKILK